MGTPKKVKLLLWEKTKNFDMEGLKFLGKPIKYGAKRVEIFSKNFSKEEKMKDRLKAIRKAKNLKQREVAERLGVTVGIVGGWECGRDAIPQTRIYQLCKEYNVRREWLERGDGEMFEPSTAKEKAQEEFITGVFERLTPEQQTRILNALRAHISAQKDGRTQTNNGTVGGDMIQY